MTGKTQATEHPGNGHSSGADEASQTAKIAAAAHSAVDTAANNLQKAETALREAREAAGLRLHESTQDARNASDDAVQSLRTYIDRHPLRSVGIAFAAGYLVSALLKK